MPKTRRRFTSEFKGEAVKLLMEGGRPLQQVAAELGVHGNQLRTWRNEQLAAGLAEALARQKAEAAELARLRRENKRLEQAGQTHEVSRLKVALKRNRRLRGTLRVAAV
jgi:transposase